MVRIGFERNEPWLERVLAIAFLSLMDRLEPIHSRRERRARWAYRDCDTKPQLLHQAPFVEKMENLLRTHFAQHEAQVHQLTVTTDAARLHSTQGSQ